MISKRTMSMFSFERSKHSTKLKKRREVTVPDKPSITSSEIGTLWMTYQQKTLIICLLDYMIEHADDEDAKTIMTDLREQLIIYIRKTKTIFEKEGAVVPTGLSSQDVNVQAPKLFTNGFDIMFLPVIKEISMGMYTLSLGKAYREDVVKFYQDLTKITQGCYDSCTQYLLKKGFYHAHLIFRCQPPLSLFLTENI